MTIYLDSTYKCHVNDSGSLRAYETDVFDGKCKTYIEGYRLIPEGEQWTREDGTVFKGLMISPLRDPELLNAAQTGYEDSLREAAAAYQKGVNSI